MKPNATTQEIIHRLLFILILLAVFSQPAHAFISWQDENQSLEMRGFLRGSGLLLRNPDNQVIYNRRSIAGLAGSGRLMIDASLANRFSFEAHAVQNYIPLKLQTGGSNLAVIRDVERSDLLDWSFDHRQAHVQIDRLNVQYASDSLNIKIGRQPVNLSATFFFTPNDFFAPFAAQTFFRAYKAGVDAARVDIQFGELSQLSLISVAGYQPDTGSDNGWNNDIDAATSSYLARASTVWDDFELALVAGSVRKDRIIGIDFQGELFDWLGIRGEGHVNDPDRTGQGRRIEFALGLEHRWENSFTLRIEQFHHGGGANDIASYQLTGTSQGLYLARYYTAVGASYEFTALLNGDATAIYNWVDQSSLLALYLLYSLSDESELALGGTITHGRKPVAAKLRSEFGLYPASASIELRAYF